MSPRSYPVRYIIILIVYRITTIIIHARDDRRNIYGIISLRCPGCAMCVCVCADDWIASLIFDR